MYYEGLLNGGQLITFHISVITEICEICEFYFDFLISFEKGLLFEEEWVYVLYAGPQIRFSGRKRCRPRFRAYFPVVPINHSTSSPYKKP